MANEFFALLAEAKTVYLYDVVLGSKQYHRYADDFVDGHRHMDCDHVTCRNYHEMNIHIVKGLLTECVSSVQPCFVAPDFTFNECMKLKWMYDTPESSSPLGPSRINRPAALSLSFGRNSTPGQMKSIVAYVNTYHLFCISVRIEDMEVLFACKKGLSTRANNICRVIILLDVLLENSFIQSRRQNAFGKGAFLQSKDGTRPVSVPTLSSTLPSIKNNMTSVAYSVRKVIDRLKK